MSIEKLRIKNFQCHGLMQMRLDPALTVIIGSSDVGKSAVVRALRWLATNKPRGHSFITHGEQECEVRVLVEGRTVIRGRGAKNLYALDDKEFVAFKDEPPEEISKLLNLDAVNFQNQHDPVFWMSGTAGQLAREINQIVDLGSIDTALDRVGQRLRAARAVVGAARRRYEQAEQQVQALAYVPALVSEFGKVEQLRCSMINSRDKLANLKNIIEQVDVFMAVLVKSGKLTILGRTVLVAAQVVEKSAVKGQALAQLILEIELTQRRLLHKTPSMSGLEKIVQRVQISVAASVRFKLAMTNILMLIDGVVAAHRALELSKQEFKRRVGDMCPICGRPIKWQ